MSDDDEFYIVGLFGLVLYIVLLLFTFFTFLWTVYKTPPCLSFSVPRLVLAFLLAFISVRIAWTTLKTFDGETGATFSLNRIAFCFYFTSFSMVIFNWAEVYHSNYIQSTSEAHQKFLPTVKWLFLLVNAGIYIFQVVVIVLYFVGDEAREGNPMYEANIIVDVGVSFVVSLLFLLYGIRLFIIRRPEVASIWGGMQDVWKVLLVTVIFTACFMLRVIMFMYRPIIGEYLDTFVFTLFGYYLPESIPVLLQVYLIQTSKRKALEETEFIESLYRESSSDLEDERAPFQNDLLSFNSFPHTRAYDIRTETSATFSTHRTRNTSRS